MIKSDNSIKKLSLIYIISLFPLILFGFYKNGISLYIKNYVSLFGMFKPLIIILLGFIIGSLVNIIYEKYINKSKDSLINIVFSNLYPIYGILIGGILGNLFDRIKFGSVIDYLDFKIFNYNFPIFNFADMCIVVSIFLLLIYFIKSEAKNARNNIW